MPLEIRELVIRVTVEETVSKKQIDLTDKIEKIKAEMVSQCTDLVLSKINLSIDR